MWYRKLISQALLPNEIIPTHDKLNLEHGKPYEFNYHHNLEKAPNMGEIYGQHIEPVGYYVIENNYEIPTGWEGGKMLLENPYIIDFGEGYKDPTNWKHVLFQKYGGLTGLKLTKALIADGYDGIITTNKYGTSEIISFKNIMKK